MNSLPLKFKRLLYRVRHDYLTLNNVVVGVALCIALSWAWGSISAMQRNYELQQMVDRKRQQVELETLRVTLLEYESKYYESAEYLDLAVRQRLGLGSPGERQIIVGSTDDTTPETSTARTASEAQKESNFQQWMNFLFGGRRGK
jgi:cell division protein FtsL